MSEQRRRIIRRAADRDLLARFETHVEESEGRHQIVTELDKRLDRIEARINLLFGALGVLVVIGNGAVAVIVGLAVK